MCASAKTHALAALVENSTNVINQCLPRAPSRRAISVTQDENEYEAVDEWVIKETIESAGLSEGTRGGQSAPCLCQATASLERPPARTGSFRP